MSRNAIALIDCNNRDTLLQFIIDYIDRKAVKNEMVSPYDDQLIGKMNFRYDGADYAMFFTFARSSEYPGMKFRNHKIIYASLGVDAVCSEVFTMICQQFGGFVNHDDDLEIGFQKVERLKANDRLPLESVAAEVQPAERNGSFESSAVEQPLESQGSACGIARLEAHEIAENIEKVCEENTCTVLDAEADHGAERLPDKETGRSAGAKSAVYQNSRNKRRRDKQRSNKDHGSLEHMKRTEEIKETSGTAPVVSPINET